jgi:hypothetical protein
MSDPFSSLASSGYGNQIRGYPQATNVLATDALILDRLGTGTMFADVSAFAAYIQVFDPYVANIISYGADPTGVADSTAAINEALASGLNVYMPAGTYIVSAQLNCTFTGQQIHGDGIQRTFIKVAAPNAGFVAGIWNITSGESGPEFYDFCTWCVQPDTAVRANLNSYPPIFYVNATARCKFERVRCSQGIDGVYLVGNCGGTNFVSMQMGCFGRNYYIDGNLDVTQWTDCQVWPFGPTAILTANLQTIMASAGSYGVYSLRNDYFKWEGGLILCGEAAYFGFQPAGAYPGNTYGAFTGTGFDTYGNVQVAAGYLTFANCTFSVAGVAAEGPGDTNAITHTGGNVTVVGGQMFCGSYPTLNEAFIYSNATTESALIVDGVDFVIQVVDQSAVYVASGSATNVVINDCKFFRTALSSFNFTTPILNIQGGSGAITGNVATLYSTLVQGNTNWLSLTNTANFYFLDGNWGNGFTVSIYDTAIASASVVTLPAVVGDNVPTIVISGSVNINSLTMATVGVAKAYQGATFTLRFLASLSVNSGTVGVAGAPILPNRASMAAVAGSSLTIRLDDNGNWRPLSVVV